MNEDQAKAIIRRLESVEKTLNLIYKDREVMEDTHVRVGTLQDEVKMLKERIEKLEKKNTADIKDVLSEVQEVKDNLENLGGD